MESTGKRLRIEISAQWVCDGQVTQGPHPVVTEYIDAALLDLCPDKRSFVMQQLDLPIQMLLMEYGVIEGR